MKCITAIGVLLFSMISMAKAQTTTTDSVSNDSHHYLNEKKDSIATLVDNAEAEISELRKNISEIETEQKQEKIWKKRAKYFYFSYANQTIKNDIQEIKSDMAFALASGRTYYLHKKPIAGILKFGLDWTYLDLNFAKYPDLSSPEDDTSDDSSIELGFLQLEAGMGLGPSVTVNPVDHLKACLYFHVTPSYSMMLQDDEFYSHYATFFNFGFTLAYKAISVGIEKRWCQPVNYNGLTLSDDMDDAENVGDIFNNVETRMKTNSWRFFLGFRF